MAAPVAWASRDDCEETLRRRKMERAARDARRDVRVGTWNIRWFPDGRPGNSPSGAGTDIPWLSCALASLDVDVLAVQEIKNTPRSQARMKDLITRLDTWTHGSWKLELDRCGKSVQQHVGLLYNSNRVIAEGFSVAAGVNPHGEACKKQLRPGLVGRFRTRGDGRVLNVISVHLKSGAQPRSARLRKASFLGLERELSALRRAYPSSILVAAGDFNTMGCKSCKPRVSPADEVERLRHSVSAAGLRLLPLVPGCSEYYRGKGGALDWIATDSPDVSVAEVSGVCAKNQCAPLPSGAAPAAISQLSDHCPVIATLRTPTP
jgi:endonuclease/exonuclease/phosphatase family metal-dependent hydrolase